MSRTCHAGIRRPDGTGNLTYATIVRRRFDPVGHRGQPVTDRGHADEAQWPLSGTTSTQSHVALCRLLLILRGFHFQAFELGFWWR
jgi:hypothetical protein